MTEHDTMISLWPDDGLHGRRKCFTDKKEITPENVVDVVSAAYSTHLKNRGEIQYLYDFFRGKQDIRRKEKQVRPEISSKGVVNCASEIVTFDYNCFVGVRIVVEPLVGAHLLNTKCPLKIGGNQDAKHTENSREVGDLLQDHCCHRQGQHRQADTAHKNLKTGPPHDSEAGREGSPHCGGGV